MADYASSLPIRTENNGDAVIKICDGVLSSQVAEVTANKELKVTVTDGSGAAVDPRAIRALTSADVVTAEQGSAAALSGAWPVKITDGTNQIAISAVGELKVEISQPLPAGTNNIGIVDSNLRDGAGNSITSGTQGSAQALDVELNVNGDLVSTSNPMPVVISPAAAGDEVLDYQTSAALAAGASTTKTYTVTALKTLALQQVSVSGSGKIKVEIQINASTKVVKFNSTAMPNIDHVFFLPQDVAAGGTVDVVITNRENQPQDVYCTIEGVER